MMNKKYYAAGLFFMCLSSLGFGKSVATHRVQQFQNSKVAV
jgi:hypothetical protein